MNNNITRKDFVYIIPASLVLGALLASVQPGNWIIGFASFSFLFLLSFSLLTLSLRWANAGRTLTYILALAFFLRLAAGTTLHLGLPVFGHEDEDDRAGYVFTDAHVRDDQAWKLASSEHPIFDAFSKKYSSDQYGGLLAFNALIYRYLSPDVQRPLMLILFSAFFAALGVPFLWKAVNQVFGENIAWASAWIFALYPESVLLGASAMREPYILTFSAFALWGFVNLFHSSGLVGERSRSGWIWLGLGILGLLLVSTPAALITIVILAGWSFFTNEKRQISWSMIAGVAILFVLGLFLLSSSLNRSGQFDATSPLHVINDWLKLAVKWDAYQLERGSGWVQKLFDEMPEWMRLPFVAIYGIFQPVLPATFIHPSPLIWQGIGVLRALGWYALLPMLLLSFGAAAASGPRPEPVVLHRRPRGANGIEGSRTTRSLILWLSLVVWIWILLAALRGGGDLWDNPRYRTILFLWQAILAGVTWVWWRQTRNVWLGRVLACEAVFLVVFTQWYINRYLKLGFQLPFAVMIALILGSWALILGIGWWRDKLRA